MKQILIFILTVSVMFSCQKATNEVIKLPFSKSEYTLLKKGSGTKGKIGDYIQFSLLVKGNDGTILADKRDPEVWAMDKVVAVDSNTIALAEMLYSMKVGDSVVYKQALLPEQKAQVPPSIDSVFYYIKMEKVMDEATMKKEQEMKSTEAMKNAEALTKRAPDVEKLTNTSLADYKAGKLSDKIQKTPSGLEYYVVEKGKGQLVKKDDFVSVLYHGIFKDSGKVFDSAFQRGEAIKFNAGQAQMIPGWDEAMLKLNVGDKAILFIPYKLAYGEAGRPPQIPAKSDLVFYIEVVSAKSAK
jgi:FKBP-type peptidyl-prolyl cis-trans isomerase